MNRRSFLGLVGKASLLAPLAGAGLLSAPEAPTNAPAAEHGPSRDYDRLQDPSSIPPSPYYRDGTLYPSMAYRPARLPTKNNPLGERAHFELSFLFPEGHQYQGYTGYVPAPEDYLSLVTVQANRIWADAREALLKQARDNEALFGYTLDGFVR